MIGPSGPCLQTADRGRWCCRAHGSLDGCWATARKGKAKANKKGKGKGKGKTNAKKTEYFSGYFLHWKAWGHKKRDWWWNESAKSGKDTASLETPIHD